MRALFPVSTPRLGRVLAVALAAVVLAAGCGVLGASPAATVNGVDLSGDALQDELGAIRDNESYRQNLEAGFGTPLTGESDGVFGSVFAARVLTLQIYYELAEQYLGEQGIEIGADDLDVVRADVVLQLGGDEAFQAFPVRYREELVRRAAIIAAVDAELAAEFRSDTAVEEYYAEHRDEFEQRCISHILVETEEEAAALRERIEGGADFADVARSESTDTGSGEAGGDLGCQSRGAFVPEFEDAAFALEVGTVSEPVRSPFGFHLILVRERTVPPLDEVRPQVEQRLAALAQEAFSAWLADITGASDVDVSPRYGAWVVGGRPGSPLGEVVPPEGPTTTSTAPGGASERG